MERESPATGLTFSGSLRISCEDFHFQLRGSNHSWVADFPSFGMLMRAKGIADHLRESLKSLPPLPPLPRARAAEPQPSGRSFTDSIPELRIAVNARPVGRLDFKDSKPKFVPTPLSFFKKI